MSELFVHNPHPKQPYNARHEHDFYVTPAGLIKSALATIERAPERVLDPGAGTGVWGMMARERWPDASISAYEIREDATPSLDYDHWIQGDFLMSKPQPMFDLVIGNPPFSYAEAFVRHSYEWLRDGGQILFLLRLAFLESQERISFWREIPLKWLYYCAKRPSFYHKRYFPKKGRKTDGTAYAVFHWAKSWRRMTWNGDVLLWDYIDVEGYDL